MHRLCLLVLFASFAGAAADLRALQATLKSMRTAKKETLGYRATSPATTVAKHQLRDWVEARLAGFEERGDEGALVRVLNKELADAGMFAGTELGYLGDMRLRRQGQFLVLETRVGIECGFDNSIYLFSWTREGWRRTWQNEQNEYTEKTYQPQRLHSVQISPWNQEGEYFVLTLGSHSWCSSAWHPVYYRVFRLGPDLEAPPILEGSEIAYLGANDPPIRGVIGQKSVWIEYTVGSIDTTVHNRTKVRRYAFPAKRLPPVALKPRDFVDEWLTSDWREASQWSEAESRKALRDWHKNLHKEFVSAEFIYPTMHCPARPDLWQVGLEGGQYYLVRWRPPYNFSLVEIREKPAADCAEKDPDADEELDVLGLVP